MKSHLSSVLLILVFLPAFSPAEEQFTIGFIAPLTGPVTETGVACRNGFEMGLDDARAPRGLKVIYEDDQFQPARAVAAFNKLVEVDNASLIISMGSGAGNALAPIAQERSMPLISWAFDRKVSAGRSHVIRAYQPPDEEVRLLASEAEDQGYTHIGSIVSMNDYALEVEKGFLSKIPPPSVVFREQVLPDVTDAKTLLLKARAAGMKELFVCGMGGFAGRVARQAREQNFKGPIFGCGTVKNPEEWQASGGALKEAWTFQCEVGSEFEKRFYGRYGDNGSSLYGASFYDLAVVLVKVLESAGKREGIIPSLLGMEEYDGALGRSRFVSRDGDQFRECVMKKWIVGR